MCILSNHYVFDIYWSINNWFIKSTYSFGLLAYRNVRQIPHRVIPLVHRELDKKVDNYGSCISYLQFFYYHIKYCGKRLYTECPFK
jgi:hypothetical protein